LPTVSVAVQLIDQVPTRKLLPGAGKHDDVMSPLTRSVACGASYATAVPLAAIASTGEIEGVDPNDGAVVSMMLTLKVAVVVWLSLSVAEQSTVFEPRANWLPDAGVQITGRTPSGSSEAVGSVYVAVAPSGPVASTLMSLGTS
jgi:hypothetical protein